MIKAVKILITFSFIFLSLASRADPNPNNVVQFKIASLQLFSSFSSFIYFQGDDRNRSRLMAAKALGDQAVTQLADSDIELIGKWKEITGYVDSYQNYSFDGVDMSLEAGWSILQKELNEIINTKHASLMESIKGIAGIQIKMESILSQYMGYANSTTGGYGVSYSNTPLEEQITHIKQELVNLAEADDKYQPIAKKWNYIQGTLLAYNSNVAPFVVLHTFDSMRKMIASY